jgi:hypothetical protein
MEEVNNTEMSSGLAKEIKEDKKAVEQKLLRMGRLSFSSKDITEKPEMLYQIFSMLQFVPVRVEHLYWQDLVDCMGISPHFEVVNQGVSVPTYLVDINVDIDGKQDSKIVVKRK